VVSFLRVRRATAWWWAKVVTNREVAMMNRRGGELSVVVSEGRGDEVRRLGVGRAAKLERRVYFLAR
jgi:hypothetical protein